MLSAESNWTRCALCFLCSKCEEVVTPLPEKLGEFCPRCVCKYEARNTKVVVVVVLLLIVALAFLSAYTLFLQVLEPVLNRAPLFAPRTRLLVRVSPLPPSPCIRRPLLTLLISPLIAPLSLTAIAALIDYRTI